MSKFMEIFNGLVVKNFKIIQQFLVSFGPKILLSISILLIGWGSAVIFKKIISKIFKALGIDVISEKVGANVFLRQGGIKSKLSIVVGLFVYWIILFSTLIMVFNTLEIEIATKLTEQIIVYIPKVMIFLVLLSFGIFIGKFFGEFAEKASRIAQLPFYILLGKITQFSIIGFTIGLGLEYIGIAIALEYTLIILAVFIIFLGVVFIVGGKDILNNMLATRLLIRTYTSGDVITFESVSGRIDSIDLISTRIISDSGEMIIPNSLLVTKIVKRATKQK